MPFCGELRKTEEEEQYKTPLIFGHSIAKNFSGVAISCDVVGMPGLEPGTSSLSVTRSNQLSYKPVNNRRNCNEKGALSQGAPYISLKIE